MTIGEWSNSSARGWRGLLVRYGSREEGEDFWILPCRVSKIVGQISMYIPMFNLYNTSQICPRSFYKHRHLKAHLGRYPMHTYIDIQTEPFLFIFLNVLIMPCMSLYILVLYSYLYGYRVLYHCTYCPNCTYIHIRIIYIDYRATNKVINRSVPRLSRTPCACPFCPHVCFIS